MYTGTNHNNTFGTDAIPRRKYGSTETGDFNNDWQEGIYIREFITAIFWLSLGKLQKGPDIQRVLLDDDDDDIRDLHSLLVL